MENYIIRIYRHEKDKPQRLMGIVEKVGEEGKKAFTHYDELWEILNASRQRVGKEDAAKMAGTRGRSERGKATESNVKMMNSRFCDSDSRCSRRR